MCGTLSKLYFSQVFRSSIIRIILKHLHLEFTDLILTQEERDWLTATCPDLTPNYLDFLAAYRFKPEQVEITFEPVSPDGLLGNIGIEASGPWSETILWEVPVMASLSQCYFETVDKDWNYDNQEGM